MKSITQTLTIEQKLLASELGSGLLDVYATPAMVAFMENTATKVIDNLETGCTTVGIEINVKHLKASKVGETITCRAILTAQEAKLYHFEIEVANSTGDIIGTATHKRVAVDAKKFMDKLG